MRLRLFRPSSLLHELTLTGVVRQQDIEADNSISHQRNVAGWRVRPSSGGTAASWQTEASCSRAFRDRVLGSLRMFHRGGSGARSCRRLGSSPNTVRRAISSPTATRAPSANCRSAPNCSIGWRGGTIATSAATRGTTGVCGMRFDFVAFAAEGLEVATAVKRALPGWTVLYWDESLDWFLAREPRSYDPARSEYEVTLADALAAQSTERPRFETETRQHDGAAADLRGKQHRW